MLTDQAVQQLTAKACVFSDSVLCMGRIIENPGKAWKEKIDWFMNSHQCQELDRLDWDSIEVEWTNFPEFTTLGILDEIQKMI